MCLFLYSARAPAMPQFGQEHQSDSGTVTCICHRPAASRAPTTRYIRPRYQDDSLRGVGTRWRSDRARSPIRRVTFAGSVARTDRAMSGSGHARSR